MYSLWSLGDRIRTQWLLWRLLGGLVGVMVPVLPMSFILNLADYLGQHLVPLSLWIIGNLDLRSLDVLLKVFMVLHLQREREN